MDKKAQLSKSNTTKGIKAFTLAEVLITLAIIGVVAVLTIPNLLHKHQVSQTVAALTKAQETFSNAFKMAEIEHGPANTWDIDPFNVEEGATKLGKILFPYLKTQKICGANTGCLGTSYKSLQGTNFNNPNLDANKGFYKAQLEDGSSVAVWSNGSGCNNNNCGSIDIDINGPKGPNRAGIDYFAFSIRSFGIIPHKGSDSQPCQHSSKNAWNGFGCTAWVIYKKNMDYTFRDISWDE